MKSKRLLTLVLALCLMISVLSPAAAAVTVAPQDAASNGSNITGIKPVDDLLDSAAGALGLPTLRNEPGKLAYEEGKWVIREADGSSVLLKDNELPAHIQALKEAKAYYAPEDRVAAFVVLGEDPTVEKYSSIADVPQKETDALMDRQDTVISAIEENVLNGETLDVITQFTYLTNSVVVETEFANLEAIAAVDGVKSVFISPVYYPCETSGSVGTMQPYTNSASVMTGVAAVWQDLGYTGAGMTIAIMDTGLDVDHPSFAAAPADPAWSQEWLQEKLDTMDLNAESLYRGELTAEKLYYNEKVPFTFNYANGTTTVIHNDNLSDHGTHVAGIAAANKVEGTNVAGMAPDAQIIAMKVFNSQTGGSNMHDLVAALEDAMALGVDVVNMSLGSPAGFSEANDEEIDSIFSRISETDIIVDIAMGNEGTSMNGSFYGNYMFTTDHIDNATVSSPATYANAVAIGSVDNSEIYTARFQLADETTVFYMQSIEYLYGYVSSLEKMAGKTLEYVIVPGLGETADFYDENGNSIVDGKVAVIKRGTTSFSEKSANAVDAGAVAVVIWNNNAEDDIFNFGMTTTNDEGNYPKIPVILITEADGQKMADAEVKTLYVSPTMAPRPSAYGGQMSSFSCWGVAPDLRLLPDMTGVGGSVYSCYDGGKYGIMSGTSMATPQVAGVTALVLQYLKQEFPNATQSEMRTLADSVMMSTAVPVIDMYTGLEASPRQQGSGLVDAKAAITAKAYLSVEGSARPKAELGESATGSYSFTFSVHNYSDAAKTYTLNASLLCEDYAEDVNYPGLYFMASMEHELDSSAVSFSQDSVTVAPGGTATVTVTIDLTKADKEWIDTYFPNGNYVEGFVYLTGEGEVTLSLPFMGFYGDWSEAPVFDDGYWYENGFWSEVYPEQINDTGIDANQYYHVPWVSLGVSEEDWILGLSPYASTVLDENGNIIYDPKNNVLSPNDDGVLDSITNWYVSLMRNALYLSFVYTDDQGNVLHEEWLDRIGKTMYNSNYGQVVPFIHDWYYDGWEYDFTDENGDPLPNGTELTLTISGYLADGDEIVDDTMIQIPIHIDTEAPKLVGEPVPSTDDDGNYLTLTIEDAHPAYVALMNHTGTQVYGTYTDTDLTDNGDGTYSIKVDVTNLGDSFQVALCDYGCNEAYFDLTYTLTDNMPEMDTSALYAYQVNHEYIEYYYGYDQMFGWTTINKTTAEVTMISSDAYEYYAINAADYVDGLIFAVDAGGNFLYMTPGLWNRHQICNLGLNVLDMAFDETTGTMYLVSKVSQGENGDLCRLYTVDLLTGKLKMLKDYGSEYEMPWAMTFVNGSLYCIENYDGFNSGLYQVDIAGGTYDLQRVLDENGEPVMLLNSKDSNTTPVYMQSMTYSRNDGVIYWAYYNGRACELVTIDPETWASKAVAMDWNQEYAALLMLEDNGYRIPESSEVTKLVMDQDRLVLSLNETKRLTASALPWNAPVSEITWTSSDERVAVVDDQGNVTGLTEGDAVITATMGSLSVTSQVTVVDVSGSLFAYNYYSGDGNWGNWLNIDLGSMDAWITAASPMDFIAADYNGHENVIYGYGEDKNLYRYEPETGLCTEIGQAHVMPYDMAYDYSTGLMYALVPDYNAGTTTLYYVNTLNGALVKAGTLGDLYLTLACDGNGQLYALSYTAKVYKLSFAPDTNLLTATYVMAGPPSTLYLIQSMCYDHQNDVLLWASAENGTIYWLDIHAKNPYYLDLGEPTESGSIEFTGLFVVPEEVEELEYTPVDHIEADDILVLTDAETNPSVTVYPLNATNHDVTYVSNDESIVRVEGDRLVGVKPGTATVTATLNDNGVEHTDTFNVIVKYQTDNIHGYLMQDHYNGNGYCWVDIPVTDPSGYEVGDYALYGGVYMTIYSAEYYDGKIYAYGYDDSDWSANFFFIILDAESGSVLDMIDMGDEFPFVYDMAFDYSTGTMYAVAGTSYATDLYMVNLNNGELIQSMLTEPMLLSLAIDEKGTMYAMALSEEIFEIDSWDPEYENAIMYTLDPEAGTCEPFMDMGMVSNTLASLAYDYDTGYLYWTRFQSRLGVYESGLYLIDPADKTCFDLGPIGVAGSSVTGLMITPDEYPPIPENLQNIAITRTLVEVNEGKTLALETFLQPAGMDVDMTWTSSDESVATVDANGVVTGVAHGQAVITVTVEDGGKTLSGSCKVVVYGAEDYFLTYNRTDGGLAAIGRPDTSVVTNLTEGEEGAMIRAMAAANGVVYAYDAEGNLFAMDVDNNYERTLIGNYDIQVPNDYEEDEDYGTYFYHHYHELDFVIRDMAWDPVNERMLAVGCYVDYRHTDGYYNGELFTQYDDDLELLDGCRLYEVDLTTGKLTDLGTMENRDGSISGIKGITVTDTGAVYVYSTVSDYICRVYMESDNYVVAISTLQNIDGRGSTDDYPMAIEYDPLTNNIFMMITRNGTKYEMFKFNVGTSAMSYVGEVGVDQSNFSGLIFNTHEHELVLKETVAPTCEEDGYTVYTCTACGREVIEVDEGTATGHNYVDGVCTECGAEEIRWTLGDVNDDGKINLKDVNLIVSYYNGNADLTEEQLKAADVNGDGKINLKDVNMVVSYYNGNIDQFPTGN